MLIVPARASVSSFSIEALHAVQISVANGVQQRLSLALALFQVLACALVGAEYFDGRHPPGAILLGRQTLRNDPAEGVRQPSSDQLLLGKRKHSNNPLYRFGSIDGMQRGEDKMAGFCRFQSNFNGFPVAHFSHQDYLGRLPKGRPQSQAEGRCVAVQFTLVDRALLMAMHKFNRVFNRHNMVGVSFINEINDGGQVEDLPDPVGPVTRTMPFFNCTMSLSWAGRPSFSKFGVSPGITRMTMA